MQSLKESLHHAIDLLGDEEARQLLDLVQQLGKKPAILPRQQGLTDDPMVRNPTVRSEFRVIQPIEGTGIAASQLLVENRR